MTFESSAQEACYKRVKDWLAGVRYRVEEDPERPVLRVKAGSSLVELAVKPWGDGDGAIRLRAKVVLNPVIDLDLALFLLRESTAQPMGGFGLDREGSIVFEHALLASGCGLEELIEALAMVSQVADRYDNLIVERWGGRRAVDLEG
ncbi:MAG: YbjN domain-containing protein [Armatimonadetes bacterium]|nr:YbjN domain-containing protein [Armatimonadota bacterium]